MVMYTVLCSKTRERLVPAIISASYIEAVHMGEGSTLGDTGVLVKEPMYTFRRNKEQI